MASTTTTTDNNDVSSATTTPTILSITPDIIQFHILPRLDPYTLASASSTSSNLHTLCSHESLWANACHSTWPSTNSPRLSHVISTFPNSYRSFFRSSSPLPFPFPNSLLSLLNHLDRIPELISAVNLFHCPNLLFSKVFETRTDTDKFRSSAFRLKVRMNNETLHSDNLIQFPVTDKSLLEFSKELRLSWILINPAARRAVNLSSWIPVSGGPSEPVTGGREVIAKFATALSGDKASWTKRTVLCKAEVRWGWGRRAWRALSLVIEDLHGGEVNVRDSLVILQRAMEG